MITAFIALGANLGDRSKTLRQALVRLDETPGVRVKAVSSFLENPAVGGPENSPAFLNAVAEIHTTLSARELLSRLLEIERSLGRQRREKWGPRTIDLDIILYGDLEIAEDDLAVPHPRMGERRFVLQPLCELAPDLVVPGAALTVRELLEGLKNEIDV
ncbi:MAG TPA: 2-amino-4-hydroxy-6-hydroxymethyldihydropteridine diphosphokinase [Tepidisphaeraceae bacterium]|jgi:2-amino-4-hydroxy-6-hydroxymethyldihydropteridine diphosphokinase|nr:2-amino-4-hydroxy-6-hydroxymethyldihydropteridine diphosphokinase [Tepidisphaeraceae bacterium]